MKIFDEGNSFPERVNFVDVNNVLVGYNLTHQCCETVGWFIENQIITKDVTSRDGNNYNIEDYIFDKSYIKEINEIDEEYGNVGANMTIFRLIAENQPFLYLHIYNRQNGYYSHGFVFKDGDTVIKEDYI